MTVTVTHSKVSAKSDTGDSSIVQPSDWNDDHVIDGLGIDTTSTAINVGSPNGESNVYVADAADGSPGIDISASGGAELYLDDLVYVGSSNADPALLSGSADPSAGGGVVAPQGSIYLRTNGTTWTKTGSGATAWAISGSGGGSVPAAVAAAALVYAYNTFR